MNVIGRRDVKTEFAADFQSVCKQLREHKVTRVRWVIYFYDDETHFDDDPELFDSDGNELGALRFNSVTIDNTAYNDAVRGLNLHSFLWELGGMISDVGVFELDVEHESASKVSDAYMTEPELETDPVERMEYRIKNGTWSGPYYPDTGDEHCPYAVQVFNDNEWKTAPYAHSFISLDEAIEAARKLTQTQPATRFFSERPGQQVRVVNNEEIPVFTAWPNGNELSAISPFAVELASVKRREIAKDTEGWNRVTWENGTPATWVTFEEARDFALANFVDTARDLRYDMRVVSANPAVTYRKMIYSVLDEAKALAESKEAPHDVVPVFYQPGQPALTCSHLHELTAADMSIIGREAAEFIRWQEVIAFARRWFGKLVSRVEIDYEFESDDEGGTYISLTDVDAYDANGNILDYDRESVQIALGDKWDDYVDYAQTHAAQLHLDPQTTISIDDDDAWFWLLRYDVEDIYHDEMYELSIDRDDSTTFYVTKPPVFANRRIFEARPQ